MSPWFRFFAVICIALACARPGRAMDQAQPGAADSHAAVSAPNPNESALASFYARQDRTLFERDIQLDDFRLLSVEHLDQLKIIDSWARQTLRTIRHRESIGGRDCVYLVLDMALRPEAWMNENIIYVESVPIREELGRLAESAAEARRIRAQALVSPAFLMRPEVDNLLEVLSRDSRQLAAVNKVLLARDTFWMLRYFPLALLPPPADRRATPWISPLDALAFARQRTAAAANPASAPADISPSLARRIQERLAMAAPRGGAVFNLPDVPPYTLAQQRDMQRALQQLDTAWKINDVAQANLALAQLGALAQAIDPAGYPSPAKRTVELWYNRTFSGTVVAFVYCASMVLFFMVAVGVGRRTGKLRRAAVGLFTLALIGHMAAMGVRWWINGRIPIQNQFESVMGSACLGCVIGLGLEAWKKNGIFGAAFAFVGFLATTVLLAAPYVFGTDLGAAPARVAGILNTGWLYIHVNIVIASYALILASAGIALIYFALRQWFWVNPVEAGADGAEGLGGSGTPPGTGDQALAAALSPAGLGAAALATGTPAHTTLAARQALLDTLDQANMVVLQMAFWMLGIGILCGAVWADQSWGRPWGWDPKETFALVTWLVYLIIVHIRLVTKHKSATTAALALVGCAIMLFNWIGVNFFLAGLHSYA